MDLYSFMLAINESYSKTLSILTQKKGNVKERERERCYTTIVNKG